MENPTFFLIAVTTLAVFTFVHGILVIGERRLRAQHDASPARSVFFRFLDAVPVLTIISRASDRPALEQKLSHAGLPAVWTAHRLLVAKEAFLLFFIPWVLWTAQASTSLALYLVYGIAVFVLGWMWPELFLSRRIIHRKRGAVRLLPYLIDLLHLQVNAGLNLESAVRGIAPTISGVWRSSLGQVVFHLDRGVSFPVVLKDCADRMDIEEFHRFVLAVTQAGKLGVSLSETLALQSEMLRTRRRQRAEEQARAASVKIALPLVFLIFPAMLIVYLAPALLHVMATL